MVFQKILKKGENILTLAYRMIFKRKLFNYKMICNIDSINMHKWYIPLFFDRDGKYAEVAFRLSAI